MYILNIDSTSRKLSITLSSNGKIISSVSKESDCRVLEMIMDDIDSTLKKAQVSIKEIDVLGVNRGPGDFTSTRVGISVAKTLSWVLDKPVYGINALDIFAHTIAGSYTGSANNKNGQDFRIILAPCLDVKKNELYFSLYWLLPVDKAVKDAEAVARINVMDQHYIIYSIGDNTLVGVDEFPRELDNLIKNIKGVKNKVVIIGGNCLEGYIDMLSEIASCEKDIFIYKKSVFPNPISLDTCVRQFIKNNTSIQRVEPIYVRGFVPFGK